LPLHRRVLIRGLVMALKTKSGCTMWLNIVCRYVDVRITICGTGKTTLNRKLMAFTRSIGGISVGCAATALAASIYNDGLFTTHGLFKFPVDKAGEFDGDPVAKFQNMQCKLDNTQNPQRRELLLACSLIVWDESCSNDKIILESLYDILNPMPNMVFHLSGDFRQILPIIGREGSKAAVLAATVCYSELWSTFCINELTQNVRLNVLGMHDEQRKQDAWARFILAVGNGDEIPHGSNYFAESFPITRDEAAEMYERPVMEEVLHDTQLYRLRNIKTIAEDIPIETQDPDDYSHSVRQLIDILIGGNFELFHPSQRFIVAATNVRVDFWNQAIQSKNPHPLHFFYSENKIAEVDDPYGILESMMKNHNVCDSLKAHDVPPHTLQLKVGDVCLLMVNWSTTHGLTKNMRVLVKAFRTNVIIVETTDDRKHNFALPRVYFEFCSSYGMSFKMIRKQFPLRLAYCLSYNRSQGQSADFIVMDTVHPPFAHGHTYVALGRCRQYTGIMVYASEKQVVRDADTRDIVAVDVVNVVHKEVLEKCNVNPHMQMD
jgi:hypothetical protein